MRDWQRISLTPEDSIREAMHRLNEVQTRILLCIDGEGVLLGVISDGDLRRALLNGYEMTDPLSNAMNREPIALSTDATEAQIARFVNARTRIIPIVDEYNRVVRVVDAQSLSSLPNGIDSVAILGLGYVGLTLALVMADVGYRVYGIEKNEAVRCRLETKKASFYERGLDRLISKHIGHAITLHSPDEVIPADAYVITVGTPLKKSTCEPRIEYLAQAVETISRSMSSGNTVVLRSTVPIGTTRGIVAKTIEGKTGLMPGRDYKLAFAPERTIEGKALEELRHNPQIVGAVDGESYRRVAQLFGPLTNTVINVESPEAAEMAKLIDNSYRDHMFAYANSIAQLAEAKGLDIHEIVEAVNFGYARNRVPKPSPGVGGACLSKDPYILATNYREENLNPELVLCARQVNETGPHLLMKKLESLLQKAGKTLDNSRIALVGMAFKGEPETSDLRESTSVWFLELFNSRSNLIAWDPVVSEGDIEELGVTYEPFETLFVDTDAVVILNNHYSYRHWDLTALIEKMRKPSVLIDTWGTFDPLEIKQYGGVLYGGIGRV